MLRQDQLTEAHNYLITDERKAAVVVAKQEKKFSTIWEQARKILLVIVTVPLPKAWKTVIYALIDVADSVAALETLKSIAGEPQEKTPVKKTTKPRVKKVKAETPDV